MQTVLHTAGSRGDANHGYIANTVLALLIITVQKKYTLAYCVF